MSDQMEFIFPEEFDKIGWDDEYYLLYLMVHSVEDVSCVFYTATGYLVALNRKGN